MTDILKMGHFLQTDSDGYIVSESSASKIVSPWKEAVEDIKTAYLEHLSDRIHSVYVRGTVSRGEAIEGLSDIDTFAVVTGEVKPEDKVWFKDLKKSLRIKYPFASDVELSLFPLRKVLDEDVGFLNRFTIQTQSACVYGHDLTLEIQPFTPDARTAGHFHRDLGKLIQMCKEGISKDLTAQNVKEWCSWIGKRIVRAGFTLVMDKEKKFTRDLYPCYEAFSKYYPEKEPEMRKALKFAIDPTEKGDEVLTLVDTFGTWIADQVEGKFKK